MVGDGRAPDPGCPTPRQKAPPPGVLVPPPQRAKPARKSGRRGVRDGSPRAHPPHPQPVGSGSRPSSRKDRRSGVGERRTPDAPHPGKRRPPRAPSCRPHSTQSHLARARAVRLVTGPHACTSSRTHSQRVVGPGRTPQRDGPWAGVEERATPDAPRPGKRRPRRTPSCRPHSTRSPVARERAVGLVTGPHACTPRTHSQWVVGAGRTPQRTGGGRGWEGARPRNPTPRQEAPPPDAPVPPQQRAKPARQSARCGVGDRSPRPRPPHPQPVGSGPRPHAPKDERWSGVEE